MPTDLCSSMLKAIKNICNETGVEVPENIKIEYNPQVHRDVCEFIERLKKMAEITRNHNIHFGYKLANSY